MLWALVVLLLLLWIGGFLFFTVAGPIIHVLLVIAVIVAIYNIVMGRRAV